MDYWEFLIQQEGDQTWLPLENQQVEILEGRYRVAVHTSLTGTLVDIRVSQLVLTEMPPRRRVRKRKGRTNDAGLLVIFPYMQLSPGRWEIHCSGTDVLDDFMGTGWERAVQLEVVPYEEDAWDPSWNSSRPEAETAASVVNPDIESGVVDPAPDLEPLGHVKSPEPVQKDVLGETGSLPLAIEVAADSTYGLQLERQAIVAQPGRTVFLEGEIFSLAGEALPDSQLSVQLRDPQTAKVLMETRQHLPAQSLPAKLSVDLKLQTNLKTRVVLGAVAIRAQVSEGVALASASFTITAGLHDLLDAIANQASVLFEEEISVYPGSTEPFTTPPAPPETLISPELPLAAPVEHRSAPAAGLTLPPQLYPPDSQEKVTSAAANSEGDVADDRTPELPKFPRRSSSTPSSTFEAPTEMPIETGGDTVAEDTVDSMLPVEDVGEAAPIGPVDDAATTDPVQEHSESAEFAALYQQVHGAEETQPVGDSFVSTEDGSPAQFDSTLEDEDLDAELAAAVLTDDDDFDDDDGDFEDSDFEGNLADVTPDQTSDAASDDGTSDSVPVAYGEESFRSLNLKERFWDRLTALTYDGHEAAARLRHEMAAAGVSPSTESASQASSPEALPTTPVAVPPVLPSAASKPPVPPATVEQTSTLPAAPPVTDEVVVYDDPPAVVPAEPPPPPERAEPITITPPKLDVPEQDLVAGELVSIRLRLKAEQYRPYAKVWMNDRQTRSLVEEPRLVMHFTPNSFGELETLMRIKVPLGCMELQIAAIAIDMSTLQESSRAVVNRHVIPPDLPAAGLDDF